MKILPVSCSLNPESTSRVLAREIDKGLKASGVDTDFIDLQESPLPFCDGASAYEDSGYKDINARVEAAQGLVFAAPIYTYDTNAASKNFIEMCGHAMQDKVVGLAVAAGGFGSMMSPMGFANSLMLDFRCHILPRYIYSVKDEVEGDKIVSEKLRLRLEEFVKEMARVTRALSG